MYITREKFEEICKKYHGLLLIERDIEDAFSFVQELLEAEADATKELEPQAFRSIDRLNAAAYEVFNLGNEIENEEFNPA